MERLAKIIQAKTQTKYWLWWGRLSPILFLIGAFGLYEIFNTEIPFLFYASWVIFITCSLIWWGWVLKIILEFIQFFSDINQVVMEIKKEVDDVHANIKELKPKDSK